MQSESKKKWCQEHKEQIKEYNKEYYKEHKAKAKKYNKKYSMRHKEEKAQYHLKYQNEAKNAYLKRKFKLSFDEHKILFNRQGGRCAICGETEKIIDHRSGEPRMLAVDHNHVTGKNRGLLCNNCNQGLGRFKESWELLDAAVAYLKSYEESYIIE